MIVNCILPQTQGLSPLHRALEHIDYEQLGQEPFTEVIANAYAEGTNDGRPCCQTQKEDNLVAWLAPRPPRRRLRPRKVALLKTALRIRRLSVLAVERAHSSNQKCAKQKYTKVRCLRRQCAGYVNRCAKARFIGISDAHRERMKSLSTLSWREFQQALQRIDHRAGRCSNCTFTYCNMKSRELKGQGYSKEDFVNLRRSSAGVKTHMH